MTTARQQRGGGLGPGKRGYQVWRAAEDYHGTGWGEPRYQRDTLTSAMCAAGHGDFAHWCTRPGLPDTLLLVAAATLDSGESCAGHVPPWTIEGRGVAREFAEACRETVRRGMRWSRHDEAILAAVIGATRGHVHDRGWCLPYDAAVNAAAYPERDVPISVIGDLAVALVRRLCDTGVNVAGGRTLAMPAPGPGTLLTVADVKRPELALWPDSMAAGWRAPPPAPARPRLLARFAAASDRLSAWFRRSVWTLPIPARCLPGWLRQVLSNLLNMVLQFGVIIGGMELTGYIAGGYAPTLAAWGQLVHRAFVPPLSPPLTLETAAFAVTWYAAGVVAGKLVRVELQPVTATPVRSLEVDMVVAFILVAVAAAWPWPGWWAAHLHLRVAVAVYSALCAVGVTAIAIAGARRRTRPGKP